MPQLGHCGQAQHTKVHTGLRSQFLDLLSNIRTVLPQARRSGRRWTVKAAWLRA